MELSVGITSPVTLLAGKGLGNYVKYRSVVLEKDGEDKLNRPFAK
jgi:Mn-dependent DtxR family transcriptional regulator